MQLHEQYRPRTFGEVVGQPKALAMIERLRKRGLAGRAYFLSGQSGTGKTTIGRLIAAEVADEFCTDELDAGAVTPSMLIELERNYQCKGLGIGGRAVIINEAHGLRQPAIRQLLVMLERLPAHVVIIFTTTNDGEESLFEDCADAHPLLSRCIEISLVRRDLAKAFAERAMMIAQREGLDGQPLERYIKLVQKHRQNLRSVLQEIEAGAMIAA